MQSTIMKKIQLTLLFILLTCVGAVKGQSALGLNDVINGKYTPENIRGIVPMIDGEHYTQMNAEGTQIIKYAFKTGKEVATIFDTTKTREAKIKSFNSYTFSPDGSKILIATERKPIYRHSYTAVHYIYHIERNVLEPLSDGGAQQAPVFSPDGHMVAW